MKVLLINDTTDWYHFGCTATSLAIKNELRTLGFTVTSFSIADCSNIEMVPDVSDFFAHKHLMSFVSSNPTLCELIQDNDIIVVNGEGTLHGTKKGPLALLYIIYVAKNGFKKHVQIINHSVYPLDTLSTEDCAALKLYKAIYKFTDYTAIREPVSALLMRNLGVQVHDSFDCLPLYIKNNYKNLEIKIDHLLIVLSGSAAWFNMNIFTANAVVEKNLTNGLIQIISVLRGKVKEGYKLKFLYSDNKNHAKDDEEMLAFLHENLGAGFSVERAKSLDAWLRCIEESGLLISGRFHHSIAAACLGTKFIALNSNTPKISGLMKALNFPEPLMYSDKNLAYKLKAAMQAPNITTNHTQVLDELCSKAQNNFTQLKRLKAKL